MVSDPITVTIDPASELGRALTAAAMASVRLEMNGRRYRVSPDPLGTGYQPDRLRDGLRRSAGTLGGEEGERLKTLVYEGREVGTRPPRMACDLPGRHRLVGRRAGRPALVVTALDRLSDQGLTVSIVSFWERFEGAFGAPNPLDRLSRFRSFLSGFDVVPLSDPIMEEFARQRSTLRAHGLLIPDFDLLIAAPAIDHDLTLLTRNRRHFDRIPGLRFDNPT